MANTVIALKKSGTPSAAPASLEFGELAINYADGVLYYKAANGTIYPFSSGGNAFATVNANGTLVVADVASDVFSLEPGSFINITGDAINDKITISANVKSVYDTANAAFDAANSNIFNTSIVIGNSEVNSISVVTSTTNDQIIDSFANTAWRSAHYHVTMNAGTDYQTTQISLIHDGFKAYMTEYGMIANANNLGIFTTVVTGNSVRLNIIPSFAATTIRMLRTTNK